MSEEIVIRVRNLSKIYQKKNKDGKLENFYALKDVNFDVKKGEVIGIFGKNGSGKSTLLKLLSGVTKPTTGTIEINGTVGSILDVGAGMHPELSGQENIFLRGELLGMKRKEIQAHYDEIVSFSELSEFIEMPVKSYSSGMFLRLAFSIIVHLKADILLLDEVMAVGDVGFRKKASDKIKGVLRKNKTILEVSHEVRSLAEDDRYFVLNKGILIKNTTDKNALDDYIVDTILEMENKVIQDAEVQKEKERVKEEEDKLANLLLEGTEKEVEEEVEEKVEVEVEVEENYQEKIKSIQIETSNVSITDFTSFDLPKDEIIIKRVSLSQDDDIFKTSKPFIVEVEYEKLTDTDSFNLIYLLSDIEGNVILTSTEFIGGQFTDATEKGNYLVKTAIPKNLLTPHIYSLSLLFVKNGSLLFKSAIEKGEVAEIIEKEQEQIADFSIVLSDVIRFKPLFYNNGKVIDLSNSPLRGTIWAGFNWEILKLN